MQGSSQSSAAQPETILQWLQKEMGYQPLGPYNAASSKSQLPSIDSLRKICGGNMILIWNFLITHVKFENTVKNIRRNITVHGGGGGGGDGGALAKARKEEGMRSKRGRRKEKLREAASAVETREATLQERDLAVKKVEKLRNIVKRQRKDLKVRMLEASRAKVERKRMLDEHSKKRYSGAFWYFLLCKGRVNLLGTCLPKSSKWT